MAHIFSETEELLVNLEPASLNGDLVDSGSSSDVAADDDDHLSKFPNLDLKNHPDIIVVTVPIQCLVEDGSKLNLFEGGNKTDLAGFYDPCAPTTLEMVQQQEDKEPEKHLLIRYLYQNYEHQVIVADSEGIKLPKTSHKVNKQSPR